MVKASISESLNSGLSSSSFGVSDLRAGPSSLCFEVSDLTRGLSSLCFGVSGLGGRRVRMAELWYFGKGTGTPFGVGCCRIMKDCLCGDASPLELAIGVGVGCCRITKECLCRDASPLELAIGVGVGFIREGGGDGFEAIPSNHVWVSEADSSSALVGDCGFSLAKVLLEALKNSDDSIASVFLPSTKGLEMI